MMINLKDGMFTIAAHSRPLRDSDAITYEPPQWYWTGEAWQDTADNAKAFFKMDELTTIANLPD